MSFRTVKLIDNVRIDNDPTSFGANHDFLGVTPKRITFLLAAVETLEPTDITITVEISPDRGLNLISYDKIITGAGIDAPASSIVLTATADDVFSLSMEDIITFVRVTVTGNGTTSTKFWDVELWMSYEY